MAPLLNSQSSDPFPNPFPISSIPGTTTTTSSVRRVTFAADPPGRTQSRSSSTTSGMQVKTMAQVDQQQERQIWVEYWAPNGSNQLR